MTSIRMQIIRHASVKKHNGIKAYSDTQAEVGKVSPD